MQQSNAFYTSDSCRWQHFYHTVCITLDYKVKAEIDFHFAITWKQVVKYNPWEAMFLNFSK